MKKAIGFFISILCSILLVFTVPADPLSDLTDFLNGLTDEAGEATDDIVTGLEDFFAQFGDGSSEEGEAPTSSEAPPAPEEETEDQKPQEEPDGSGIPKDEPVSKTGTLYGYTGTFDPDTATSEQVSLTEGEWDINDVQMLFWGGPVIENNGTASLAVRNSYIRGETAAETAPLEGNSGGLLVAGSLRTTLGTGNSESIYINSSVISRNRAALSADAAQPALAEGQKELGLYAYGTEAIAMDGGYGAYSDLFCNLYAYGSHMQGAEIGIISGTYGKVTIGTVGDGEKNETLASILTDSDRSARSDKNLQSVVEGGRNALMIHSVSLPSYWEYEGYSQEELPLKSTKISAHGSTLRTDLSLDKGVAYEPQKQAYIDHTKGSVILIKSTNADIVLDGCSIVPDEQGTGNLIQTVYNNDTQFMNAVPDGQNYPGINVSMRDMELAGDIAHEDYQRDLNLVFAGTTLTGSMNEYDCGHWKQAAESEGFPDYSMDEAYGTHHGLQLTMQEGSVWTVTEESHLSRLSIGSDCKVEGLIFVDDIEQPNVPGTTYEGRVAVKPGTPQEETTEEETTTQPEPATPESTEHVHNWQRDGGSPATCTEDATYGWVCYECGASFVETLEGTAMGHDWQFADAYPVTCISDGYNVYQCSRCGETITGDYYPATGHDWQLTSSIAATCTDWGQDVYTCSYCGEVYYEDFPPYGHDYVYAGYFDDELHYMTCNYCGHTEGMIHVGDPCYVCGHTGPVG